MGMMFSLWDLKFESKLARLFAVLIRMIYSVTTTMGT